MKSVHRGVVQAWGIWFPPGTVACQTRVLALWESEDSLWRAADGILLRFARLRRLDTAVCPGLAVVEVEGVVSSFPGCEVASSSGKDFGDLRIFWRGAAHDLKRSSLEPVDFSSWVAFDRVIIGEALAEPRVAPRQVAEVVFDINKELPGAPEPSSRLKQLLQDFEASKTPADAPPAGRPGWLQTLANLVNPAVSPSQMYRAPAAPQPPGPLENLWNKLKRKLSPSHNQKYMDEMIALFEKGDYAEALRYGIPLGGIPPSFRAELGLLRPRDRLDLLAGSAATSVIGINSQGEGYLRSLYKTAAERLLKAGRIDEAVYTYVQLLDDVPEALKILEEHKQYLVAARLAQVRGISPEQQIRLFFLGGEVGTALEIARRHEKHWQVRYALQKVDPAAAQRWMAEWARHVASRGRFGLAADLLWEQRAAYPAVRGWAAESIAAGDAWAGPVMARVLADPVEGEEDALRATVSAWLASDNGARLVGLMKGLGERDNGSSPLSAEIASRCARAYLPRHQELALQPKEFQNLLKMGEDVLLRSDLPPFPKLETRTEVWREVLPARGKVRVRDAMLLGDGRMLCALGEAGVVVLSSQGRQSALLPVPCHQIVRPWDGTRYLLMGSPLRVDKGFKQWKLSWLDVANLRVQPWQTVRLGAFATEYDGECWLAEAENALYQLDVQSSDWRSLWKVPMKGRIAKLALGQRQFSLLLGCEKDWSYEGYTYPDMQLRTRKESKELHAGVSEGHLIETLFKDDGFVVAGHSHVYPWGPACIWGESQITHGGELSVLSYGIEGGSVLWAFSRSGHFGPAEFLLEKVQRPRIRIQGDLLIVVDEEGGIRVADVKRGIWLRQFFL